MAGLLPNNSEDRMPQTDYTGYAAVTLTTNADWTLTPGAPSNATALQIINVPKDAKE